MEEKKKIIDPMIKTLVTRYQHIAEKIALKDWQGNPVRPRFNKKINSLIWIAGGNGDDKERYRDDILPEHPLIEEKIDMIINEVGESQWEKMNPVDKNLLLREKHINVYDFNTVFSDDLSFIKGYEYVPPKDLLSQKTKIQPVSLISKALSTLKEKLIKLATMLG